PRQRAWNRAARATGRSTRARGGGRGSGAHVLRVAPTASRRIRSDYWSRTVRLPLRGRGQPIFHAGLRRRTSKTGGSTPTTRTPASRRIAYTGTLACPSWLGGRSPITHARAEATVPTTQIRISAGAR